MLLFLLFDNSILSKSHIQQSLISFSRFCSLQYRLFCNLCLSWKMLDFWLYWRRIVMLWAHIYTQCLDYLLCETKTCWCSVDTHCHDEMAYLSCTVVVEKVAITLYMNYLQKVTLVWAKMQDQKSFTLYWRSFPQWGRKGLVSVLAPNVCQYLIYGCLPQITA